MFVKTYCIEICYVVVFDVMLFYFVLYNANAHLFWFGTFGYKLCSIMVVNMTGYIVIYIYYIDLNDRTTHCATCCFFLG